MLLPQKLLCECKWSKIKMNCLSLILQHRVHFKTIKFPIYFLLARFLCFSVGFRFSWFCGVDFFTAKLQTHFRLWTHKRRRVVSVSVFFCTFLCSPLFFFFILVNWINAITWRMYFNFTFDSTPFNTRSHLILLLISPCFIFRIDSSSLRFISPF